MNQGENIEWACDSNSILIWINPYTPIFNKILFIVRANDLEGILNKIKTCPNQFLMMKLETQMVLHMKNQHLLLRRNKIKCSWTDSSLLLMLNNLSKCFMSITKYFGKLRSIIDELVVAGSLVSNLDFITHLV